MEVFAPLTARFESSTMKQRKAYNAFGTASQITRHSDERARVCLPAGESFSSLPTPFLLINTVQHETTKRHNTHTFSFRTHTHPPTCRNQTTPNHLSQKGGDYYSPNPIHPSTPVESSERSTRTIQSITPVPPQHSIKPLSLV